MPDHPKLANFATQLARLAQNLGRPAPNLTAPPTPAKVQPGAGRQFADTATALSTLIERGQSLSEAGLLPRLPIERYLETVDQVLHFVVAHPLLHTEVNLSAEMCGAVLRIAQELRGEAPSARRLSEPLPVLSPLSVQHEEALRTGVLLLSAFRQAVSQALRGPQAQAARAEFAVDGELGTRDGILVAEGIARFLHAAERYPEVVSAARLTGPQLLGLAAQERVLRALHEQRQREAIAAGSTYRRRVLHLALESFFDRYSAALLVRLLPQPDEQLRGLALVPRSGSAARLGRDSATCQVTDSGRLVF